jgi:hypothetical protein
LTERSVSEGTTETESEEETEESEEETESEQEEPNMSATTSKTTAPAPAATLPAPKEMKVNLPKEFHGDREDTTRFIQDLDMYFFVNGGIYDTDGKKIVFTLSLMAGGYAQTWKQAYITDASKSGTFVTGTFDEFKALLKSDFGGSDTAGNARAELKNIKQTNSADEYVSQFRILASRSGIKDDTALIEYFMEGLKPKVLEKIYSLPAIPVTIKEWYDHATKFDNQWNRVREIIARSKGGPTPKKHIPTGLKYSGYRDSGNRDPNAMDIDRLTTEQSNEHIKKGLCFGCHKAGHIRRDCPENSAYKKQEQTSYPNKFKNFKKTGATTYAMIRSLYQELNEEDRAEVIKRMEDEGF